MKFKKINVSGFLNRRFNGAYRDGVSECNSSNPNCSGVACKKNAISGRYENMDTGCCEGKRDGGMNAPFGYRENYGTTQPKCSSSAVRDRGNEPIVFDIQKEAFMTQDFRTALWTGGNLQLTVMTIPVDGEIGVEMHEGVDQLIGVVSGAGEVVFGNRESYFAPPLPLDSHSVVLVPAGTYHNVKNVGRTPLKLYSVYAPKVHKFGTVDKTNPE